MLIESEILAEAIGRYTLQILGSYGVSVVRVADDASRREAILDLSLEDPSFDAQTKVFEHVHELEDHYENDGIKLYMLPYDARDPLFGTGPEDDEQPRQRQCVRLPQHEFGRYQLAGIALSGLSR